MAVSKQQHVHVAQSICAEGDAQKQWLRSIFFLVRMFPCRNRLCIWKSHMDTMKRLTPEFTPHRKKNPGANRLQKKNYSFTTNFLHWKKIWLARLFFHDSFPRASTCSTLPWRPLVSSEANYALTLVCTCKKYWIRLQISSDLPQVAVPVVSEFLAPLFLCFPGLTLLLLVHLLMYEGCTWN